MDDSKQIAINSARCLGKISEEIHQAIKFIESVSKDTETSESEKKEIYSSVQFKENDHFLKSSNQSQDDYYTLNQLLSSHKLVYIFDFS